MICLVCPECKKVNYRAEPVREDTTCDNCGSILIQLEENK